MSLNVDYDCDYTNIKKTQMQTQLAIDLFTEIIGVCPIKAAELAANGFSTIQQLREKPTSLNKTQRIGLQYYEQLLQRIPRQEITQYSILIEACCACTSSDLRFDIVGSYRRGAITSDVIDVIITSSIPDHYYNLIDLLITKKIILVTLSREQLKCIAISQLSTTHIPRCIDFVFTPVKEYPFAILYFTGSTKFNTFFHSVANEQGYSMNEHAITNTITGKQINDTIFETEQDIFHFVGLNYIDPIKREEYIY